MSRRLLLPLVCLLPALALARDKAENWLEVRSPHFTVVSNGSEKQARHVAGQFERMRLVFHNEFPTMTIDPGTPIVVLAINDEQTFRALEPPAYLAKGQLHLAGLFKRAPDKNYILLQLSARGEHPYATIYHEYAHLILSKIESWLPLWLNEGWAEFYQTTEIRDSDYEIGLPSKENIFLLQQNRLVPLTTLLAVDRNSPYYHQENKGSIFYAESWALTHYLTVNGARMQLQNYQDLVRQNIDPVTAGTRAFGDLNQLQAALQKYVSMFAFRYASLPMSTTVDEASFKVQPLIPAQVDAVQADFLAYEDRIADSRALLTEVLHDDPGNALAHETMGYLAFREGHLDQARNWYEQAVKLDSQSFLAHYYFAAMSMDSGALSPDRETQVESSLRAAIKLNPSFAPSYDELAVFFGQRHKNLDEAHILELTAVELDPGNIRYRMNTANLLLEMQRVRDAITVLQNSLKIAKSPEEVSSVQKVLQSAEQYQAMEEAQHEAEQESQPSEAQPLSSGSPESNRAAEPAPHGPWHTANGTLKNVQCSYPAVMQLNLEGDASTLTLHSDNYFKIQYSAVNFTPTGKLKPCIDLEGMKAHVEFFELTGKPAEGQIVSIQLSK